MVDKNIKKLVSKVKPRSQYKLHSVSDAKKSKAFMISYPSESELRKEIDRGYTDQFMKDIDMVANSDFSIIEPQLKKAVNKILKSPCITEEYKDWIPMSIVYNEVKKYHPLSDQLIGIYEYRLPLTMRLLYEVYNINGELNIVFTNLNLHEYRDRLYSLTPYVYKYRNDYVDLDLPNKTELENHYL